MIIKRHCEYIHQSRFTAADSPGKLEETFIGNKASFLNSQCLFMRLSQQENAPVSLLITI